MRNIYDTDCLCDAPAKPPAWVENASYLTGVTLANIFSSVSKLFSLSFSEIQ